MNLKPDVLLFMQFICSNINIDIDGSGALLTNCMYCMNNTFHIGKLWDEALFVGEVEGAADASFN